MGSFLAADLRRKWPNKSLTLTKRADWSHTETRGARLRRSEYWPRTFLARPPDLQELWPSFHCSAVSETRHLEGDTERGISFRLAGALGALEPRELPTESWTGERTIKRRGNKLDLGVSWPGTIELRNEYLWEQSDGPNRGRYAYVPTLDLGCDVSKDELPDEAFIDQAKDLVDDVTLLMSVCVSPLDRLVLLFVLDARGCISIPIPQQQGHPQ